MNIEVLYKEGLLTKMNLTLRYFEIDKKMKHKKRQPFNFKMISLLSIGILLISFLFYLFLPDETLAFAMGYIKLEHVTEIAWDEISKNNSENLSMKIIINQTDITQMTRDELSKFIDEELMIQKERKIKAYYQDKSFEIQRGNLGLTFDKDKEALLTEIEKFKTEQLIMQKIHQLQIPAVEEFVLKYVYQEEKIEEWIRTIQSEVEILQKEPTVIKNEVGSIEQIPGLPGIAIKKDELKLNIQQTLLNKTDNLLLIEILTESTFPQRDSELLEKVDTMITSFTSIYPVGNAERAENVRLGASHVNQTVLMPGEEFSFTDKVAPVTLEAGYKNATTFLNGKPIDGVGGGVCQVSSTLYNVQLQAGIIAVQRQNHSLIVDYVPRGQDATIATGLIDYRFINTLDYPIYIDATTNKGVLTIEFWSNSDALNGITYRPRTIFYGLTDDGKRRYDTTLYGYNSKGEIVFEKYLHRSHYRIQETS